MPTHHPDTVQPLPEPPEQAKETTLVSQPHFIKKVGNTTYHVNVYFSQTSKETLEDKIERLILQEIDQQKR
ncbi:transposon-encoded TnpW family protein [Bengtsoniella intestinalis]|uniref:transposon-encoded TnpW family protein n=1 Tax=Bengtsoniella intestinalis TaxID=3073143 RepID=UPI00391F4B7A